MVAFLHSRLHCMTYTGGCRTAGSNLLSDIRTDGTKRRLRYRSQISPLPTGDEYIYIFNHCQIRTPSISETVPVADKDDHDHLQPPSTTAQRSPLYEQHRPTPQDVQYESHLQLCVGRPPTNNDSHTSSGRSALVVGSSEIILYPSSSAVPP